MFERPRAGERAILVQLALPGSLISRDLAEFEELARSADAIILDSVVGHRSCPDAKYFIGQGKALDIADLVKVLDADLVLVNHELSPAQVRNLERLFQCRVVDRSGLILDIFAKRAKSFEGRLQVELAQLEYLSTRLIRGWTHLERQKGGIGLRGPGESQLETDRRLLRIRIKNIHKRLEKVRQSRAQNRMMRQKTDMPVLSLVGYTNAGKSTLFNNLTKDSVYVANQLFATLDPTMRKLDLPGAKSVILADTVGFIRDLPHDLVKAFRATLEEIKEADLLIHVVDISDQNCQEAIDSVQQVLDELGASGIPIIQVFNKIDLKGYEAEINRHAGFYKVWLSSVTGLGLDLLKEAISTELFGAYLTEKVLIKNSQAKLRANLYQLGAVLGESLTKEGDWLMDIRITKGQKQTLLPWLFE